MNIILTRTRKGKDHIDGHLSTINGMICHTVENYQCHLAPGQYTVQIIKCKQHARKMPIVVIKGIPACDECPKLKYVCNNTPMPCLCPQLCPGNGMHNRLDGAIILGDYICPGALKHPKEAFDRLYELIRKSAERGHEITLTIKEDFPAPPSRELTNFQLGQQILKQF